MPVIEYRAHSKLFRIGSNYPINDLQVCLASISTRSSDALTSPAHVELELDSVVITPPVLVLLVKLLSANQHPQSKLQNSPWSNKVDVTLSECRFACQRDASTRSTVDNTFDFLESVQVFVSLLAHRTSRLTLDVGDCPSILDALCDFPQVEMNTWIITKREISASECKRLAACVQRSVHLKHLDVKTTHIEEPHM